MVGVPGRIIYRSGVRVEPLEHGLLPDAEARVIRALVDRIEQLEQQVQQIQQVHPSISFPAVASVRVPSTPNSQVLTREASVTETRSCRLENKVIEEFLDGAGI